MNLWNAKIHDMVVMVAVARVDYTSIDPKQAAEWVPPLRTEDLVDLLPGRGVRERAPDDDMAEDQALALANVLPASARADKAVDELPSVTKLIRIGNNARKMIVQIFALRFNLPLLITSAATPTANARPALRRAICRTPPDARTKRFSRFVPRGLGMGTSSLGLPFSCTDTAHQNAAPAAPQSSDLRQ